MVLWASMTPEDVISQYPGPVRLQSPLTKVLFIPVLVVALSVFWSLSGDPHGKAAAIVFGGLFVVCALRQHFRPAVIELTAWGFTATDLFGGRSKLRWRDVSEFTVVWSRTARVQYFDTNAEGRWSSGARVVPDAHPFSAQQMAELMNAWRERALF